MTNQKIMETVRSLVGIPYKHGGRTVDGLDCLGLIYVFYRELGIVIPDHDGRGYSLNWYKEDPKRFYRGLQSVGREISPTEVKPLDLVYFRIGGEVTHAGVVIDQHHFLHVLKGKPVHVSPLNLAWRRRLAGVRRLRTDDQIFKQKKTP